MIFHYEGHTRLGQPVVGQVEADSEADAARAIREDRGHYARELKTTPVEAKYEVPAVGGVSPLPEVAAMDSEESPTWSPYFSYPNPEDVTTEHVPPEAAGVDEPPVKEVSVKAKPVTRSGGSVESPPCGRPPKREVPAATGSTLKDNVERGAEGLRQLLRWSEAARKGERHDDMPAMGKKAWELFESSFREIAVGVFREAVVRSIFRE